MAEQSYESPRTFKSWRAACVGVLLALSVAACDSQEPPANSASTPTPTATPGSAVTQEAAAASTPTATPTATPGSAVTQEAAAASTPTATPAATPGSAVTPVPTGTSTPAAALAQQALTFSEYLRWCSSLEDGESIFEDMRDRTFTWSEATQLVEDLIAEWNGILPPAEVEPYHKANLEFLQEFRDTTAEQNPQLSLSIFEKVAFASLVSVYVYGTDMIEPRIVNSLVEAKCIILE